MGKDGNAGQPVVTDMASGNQSGRAMYNSIVAIVRDESFAKKVTPAEVIGILEAIKAMYVYDNFIAKTR